MVSSAWPGRILHYLLFTLYTGGQRKWWGLGKIKCLNTAGGTNSSLFLDQSLSCYCGCFTQEWHRGPQGEKNHTTHCCTGQSAPAGRSWWRIMSAKGKQKQLWPLVASRPLLYTVKHSQLMHDIQSTQTCDMWVSEYMQYYLIQADKLECWQFRFTLKKLRVAWRSVKLYLKKEVLAEVLTLFIVCAHIDFQIWISESSWPK